VKARGEPYVLSRKYKNAQQDSDTLEEYCNNCAHANNEEACGNDGLLTEGTKIVGHIVVRRLWFIRRW